MPIKVGRGAQEVKIDKALVAEIIYTIQEHGIDVAIFDPLVTIDRTSEPRMRASRKSRTQRIIFVTACQGTFSAAC
jgi:hypothetical protein